MGIPIIAGFGEGRKRGRTPSKGGGTKLGYSPKPYVPPVVPPASSGDDYDESLFVPQEEDNTFSQGNPWKLNYQQIAGAPKGGQNLQDVVQYLFDRTRDAGWFGDYTGDLSSGIQGDTGQYNLDNLINMLTGESSSFMEGLTEDERQGYGALGGMLQDINLGGLTKGYGQTMGDISSEILGRTKGLQKGYGVGQKTSRYGKIGGGGRNLGGSSRGQYMSDIYGLQQKQQELTRSAQEELEQDFYGQVGSWMTFNKPPIN